MINFEIFVFGLLLISTVTGLFTEAIKKIFAEYNKVYHANTLAGIISIFVSGVVGICYVILSKIQFTSSIIIYLVCLVIISWLCSMVGYDKVIQTFNQFKIKNKED